MDTTHDKASNCQTSMPGLDVMYRSPSWDKLGTTTTKSARTQLIPVLRAKDGNPQRVNAAHAHAPVEASFKTSVAKKKQIGEGGKNRPSTPVVHKKMGGEPSPKGRMPLSRRKTDNDDQHLDSAHSPHSTTISRRAALAAPGSRPALQAKPGHATNVRPNSRVKPSEKAPHPVSSIKALHGKGQSGSRHIQHGTQTSNNKNQVVGKPQPSTRRQPCDVRRSVILLQQQKRLVSSSLFLLNDTSSASSQPRSKQPQQHVLKANTSASASVLARPPSQASGLFEGKKKPLPPQQKRSSISDGRRASLTRIPSKTTGVARRGRPPVDKTHAAHSAAARPPDGVTSATHVHVIQEEGPMSSFSNTIDNDAVLRDTVSREMEGASHQLGAVAEDDMPEHCEPTTPAEEAQGLPFDAKNQRHVNGLNGLKDSVLSPTSSKSHAQQCGKHEPAVHGGGGRPNALANQAVVDDISSLVAALEKLKSMVIDCSINDVGYSQDSPYVPILAFVNAHKLREFTSEDVLSNASRIRRYHGTVATDTDETELEASSQQPETPALGNVLRQATHSTDDCNSSEEERHGASQPQFSPSIQPRRGQCLSSSSPLVGHLPESRSIEDALRYILTNSDGSSPVFNTRSSSLAGEMSRRLTGGQRNQRGHGAAPGGALFERPLLHIAECMAPPEGPDGNTMTETGSSHTAAAAAEAAEAAQFDGLAQLSQSSSTYATYTDAPPKYSSCSSNQHLPGERLEAGEEAAGDASPGQGADAHPKEDSDSADVVAASESSFAEIAYAAAAAAAPSAGLKRVKGDVRTGVRRKFGFKFRGQAARQT
ncbi:hypothetical protein EsDP_00005208 [Epichloe bromicola]|uniref:Uncharacterized protein n=1 Tax=Epichloe bromicola TaxID=79588 RepID=A0ABQ0CTZ8_9HYPO